MKQMERWKEGGVEEKKFRQESASLTGDSNLYHLLPSSVIKFGSIPESSIFSTFFTEPCSTCSTNLRWFA